MESKESNQGRMRRTVNDLVMAEMFLLQATIESANAIGEGIDELGDVERSWSEISDLLRRTGTQALEPYTTRYRYFREMIDADES